MDFIFCSASDGTNVVSAFETAIEKAYKYSQQPSEDFVDQVSSEPQLLLAFSLPSCVVVAARSSPMSP